MPLESMKILEDLLSGLNPRIAQAGRSIAREDFNDGANVLKSLALKANVLEVMLRELHDHGKE